MSERRARGREVFACFNNGGGKAVCDAAALSPACR